MTGVDSAITPRTASKNALIISRIPRRIALVAIAIAIAAPSLAAGSFIGPFTTISEVAPTVPENGDVNPYGVAVVPTSAGKLVKDDILVSNFNASSNKQGTGSTIVEISPLGSVTLFSQITPGQVSGCPGGVGLTTALVALQSGFVVVGSLPTSDGTSATAKPGCLIVLDKNGTVAEIIAGSKINGPWDMTAFDSGTKASLFVTNVLNGTLAASPQVVNGGTVVRIDLEIPAGGTPSMKKGIVIASGFPERTDPAALVIGPTGLGLSADGETLFVADTLASRIASISNPLNRHNSAGIGTTVAQGVPLNGPLGLAVAPNGDILTVNSGDGNVVESTVTGTTAAIATLDTTAAPPLPSGAGTLFGLAVVPGGGGVYFVDDAENQLNLFH
jgi:hypothetical protein